MKKAPRLRVHLNLVEGHCAAPPKRIPLLADGRGYLKNTWGQLFLRCLFAGKKSALAEQLKIEIRAQIQRLLTLFGPEAPWPGAGLPKSGPVGAGKGTPPQGESAPGAGCEKPGTFAGICGDGLYLDGHQHTQMIPAVFDAICDVCGECGWKVVYIRNSIEPLSPYLKETGLYATYRPVNLVKNLILRLCGLFVSPKMAKMGLRPMYLWGLVMSGHMDGERVRCLLPGMERVAKANGRQLEILFHPGRLLEEEASREYNHPDALPFYQSAERDMEYETLCRLAAELKGGICG